ncbi:hypothetical protein DRO58_07445 [Candidatus Bathyarchaeota archaeon]|nr:MAG: hypothetical protein DRO58_07445 [Candidatus Bathyarchaeota archaeon]
MNLVLDSNIIIKLVITEPGSEEVRKFILESLEKGASMYSVDIALAEGLNALWKHVSIHRDLKVEDAESATEDLAKIYGKLNIVATGEVSREALKLSLTHNITVYDTLYIAAARKLKATLYTADSKLYRVARKLSSSKLLET